MKRVHLWEPGTGQQSICVVRSAAVALANFAVDGDRGRGVHDPVHDWVTEGRRRRNEERRRRGSKELPYSSCGDLPHWLATCLGCRDESVVNRTDDGGIRDWVMSVNLSRFRYSPWWVPEGGGREPDLGDVLLTGNLDSGADAHVCVLTRYLDQSADYGQPYAERKRLDVTQGPGYRIIRGRRLRGWIDLALVPLVESAVVPDDFAGGVPDDNP